MNIKKEQNEVGNKIAECAANAFVVATRQHETRDSTVVTRKHWQNKRELEQGSFKHFQAGVKHTGNYVYRDKHMT